MKKLLINAIGYLLLGAMLLAIIFTIFNRYKDMYDYTWEVIEITLNTAPEENYQTLDTLWEVACYYCPSSVDKHQYIDMVEKLNGKNVSELKRYETIKIYVAWAEGTE